MLSYFDLIIFNTIRYNQELFTIIYPYNIPFNKQKPVLLSKEKKKTRKNIKKHDEKLQVEIQFPENNQF